MLLKQLKSIIANLNNDKKKGNYVLKKANNSDKKNSNLNVIKIDAI